MSISLPSWKLRANGKQNDPSSGDVLYDITQDIAALAPMGIVCLAASGKFLWANAKLFEQLECSETECLSDSPFSFADEKSGLDQLRECLPNGGELSDHEVRLTRRDGSAWRAIVSTRTVTRGNAPLHRICFVRARGEDEGATPPLEQRPADASLSVLNQIDALIAASDHEGRLVYWNDQCRRVTGLDLADVQKMDLAPRFLRAGEPIQYMPPGVGTRYETVAYRAGDGRRVFVQWRALAKPPVEGWAVCAVGRDITELEWSRRQQDVLARVLGILGPAPTLETGLRQTLEALCQATEMQLGEIWKANADTGIMTLWETWHEGGEVFDAFVRGSRNYSFEPGIGLPGRAWRNGRAEWMVNLPNEYDSAFVRTELTRKAGIRSILSVPLMVDSEVVAVFLFHSTQTLPVEAGIISMVETVCGQVAGTILRRNAEATAQEVAERYRLISEATTDLVYAYSFDQTGSMKLDWYAGGETSGLSPSILCEWSGPEGCWAGLVIDDDKPAYLKRVQLLLSGKKSVDELRIVEGADGNVKWVRLTGIPILDATTGQVRRIVGSATDITGEKSANEKLRRREIELETIDREAVCAQKISWHLWHSGKSIPEGISKVPDVLRNGMQNPDGICVSLSIGEAGWRTTGFSETSWMVDAPIEYRGKTVGMLVVAHVDSETDPFLAVERQLIAEVARRIGIAYGFMMYQSELKASEGRYRAIVDAQSELVARFTVDGECRFTNEAMCGFFETDHGLLIGRNLIPMIAGDKIAQFKQLLAQIDDRHPDFALMSTTDRGNGDVRHVSWICTGIFNDDGDRPMEIQTVGRDVTDLVTAEREVKESRRREREHERRLARVQRAALAQELTAGFGHQISQPLSSMAAHFGTCLHMLKSRHPDDEDIVRLIERGLKQVEVTGSMVKDYARLLRLPDQVPNELDMRQLVRGVVDLMEGYLCINNVTLDFMPGDQPLRVNGTELEIQQVLLNLVTNAVEAMQDSTGRRLEIRLGRRNGYVTCAIADSGPKLAKRDYEHMFEWFNTTKKDGLGMGLAVAKSIMERHGGKIKVRPNHPQGAIFTALIPDISAETPHVEHL